MFNFYRGNGFCFFFFTIKYFNKTRRNTKLITRRFEDILSSLSSDRKNLVLKFKGANIRYVFLSLNNEDKMSSKSSCN